MDILKNLNLGIRFILELCLLGAFALAGFHLTQDQALKWLAVFGLPCLAAVIWGMFIAPKSRYPLAQPARLIVELLLFGFASWLLYEAGYPKTATTFIVAVVVNELFVYIWKQ